MQVYPGIPPRTVPQVTRATKRMAPEKKIEDYRLELIHSKFSITPTRTSMRISTGRKIERKINRKKKNVRQI